MVLVTFSLIIIVFSASFSTDKNVHKIMKSWIHAIMEWFGLERT